ncbi:MAG TPA: hypothetical protein VGL71_08440 [Urbifossiella sp.]
MITRIHIMSRCGQADTLEKRLACLADAGPQAIDERLEQIGTEWSAGRMTKAVIGVAVIVGLILTVLVTPWCVFLPLLGGVFLLQYLFGRTSWLGEAFQKAGFRSGSDIDQEKFALKALRGDFRNLPTVHEIENKDDITRLEGEGGIALDPEESKVDAKEAVREALEAAKS